MPSVLRLHLRPAWKSGVVTCVLRRRQDGTENGVFPPFRLSWPNPDLLYGCSGDPGYGEVTQSQFLASSLLTRLKMKPMGQHRLSVCKSGRRVSTYTFSLVFLKSSC